MSYAVMGAFERSSGGYEGFCWSPDHPAKRLVVEIRDDDVLVTSVVASRFSSEHRDQHLGDGRVGFRIADAMLPPMHGVVEARERDSGYLLGRHILSEAAIGGDLPRLEAELALLDRRVEEVSERYRERPAARLRPQLKSLRSEGLVIVAEPQAVISGRHARLSMVLTVSSSLERTAAAVARLRAGGLAKTVELILVDTCSDDAQAEFCRVLDGCTYIRAAGPGARNHAAAIASGSTLAFADADRLSEADSDDAAIWFDDELALGGAGAALYRDSGMGPVRGWPADDFAGLHLLIDRERFIRLGGFNSQLPALEGLAELDLFTRAMALGERGDGALAGLRV